jgi:type 1 glutamine amidotransferase
LHAAGDRFSPSISVRPWERFIMRKQQSLVSSSLILVLLTLLVSARLPRTARGDEPDQPIRALLVIGGCCHDYEKQKDILTQGISARANVQWTIAYDPDKGTGHLNPIYDKEDWAKGYDVIVHDECSADVKDLKIIERILKPHRDGLPAVLLHCGMHSYRSEGFPEKVTPWFEFTGLKTTGHGPQLPIAISFVDREHSITKSLQDWTTIKEELYNNTTGELLDKGHILARGKQTVPQKDGSQKVEDTIVAWTNEYHGKTRVFATTLGHNNDTVADSRYLDFVTRGLLWSVDKLDERYLRSAEKALIEK